MTGEERWEIIYNQINGVYVSDICEGAKDETSEGGKLGILIEQAYEARNHICERLGIDPEDPDMEQLISGFEKFSRAYGKLMYHYGYLDGAHKM